MIMKWLSLALVLILLSVFMIQQLYYKTRMEELGGGGGSRWAIALSILAWWCSGQDYLLFIF